ncbi:MAG: DUF2652 domain-containing protein [Actinomycetota bacterium]|nr:DUF2652 domain-containing protein [Actinomycetota bacterium]
MIDLGTPEKGCLLFADITGYTDYLAGTELMHAQDVLADLLETIVSSISPTFALSKLEGDAAFARAESNSINPSMVMDTVESAYFAFKKRLRDVVHSTTCECNACIRIPTLDLKFFVHEGEYVTRQIAGSEELTGPDVVLVHRLAKGSSGAAIGKPAYAVYTAKTLSQMAMDPSILGFVPHTEEFGDVGQVEVFIQDLGVRWAFEQERHRDLVPSNNAIYERTFETSASPATVWDYLTDPRKRPLWQHLVTEVLAQTDGRMGVGSINHCMHGPDVIVEHVADWRPFAYMTLRYDLEGIVDKWAWTWNLDETDGATVVSLRLSDPGEEAWNTVGDAMIANVDDSIRQLSGLLPSGD